MTTPDGREGWSDMFLRKGHSVFLVDEPRRGEAGQTSVSGTISTKTLDQRWYTQFRIGRWENGKSVVNEGSQFPNDENSVDQFFRQMTPDTGMTSDMASYRIFITSLNYQRRYNAPMRQDINRPVNHLSYNLSLLTEELIETSANSKPNL